MLISLWRYFSGFIGRTFRSRKPAMRDHRGRFCSISRTAKKKPTSCSACWGDSVTCIKLSCGHSYCSRCLKRLFQSALNDTNLLPVKCCENLDQKLNRKVLKKSDSVLFESRLQEKLTIEKMYCPNRNCSAFINLSNISTQLSNQKISFKCPNCNISLCSRCKASHPNYSCEQFQLLPADEKSPEDLALYKIAQKKHYARCPRCRSYVERITGCNHVICRCKSSFCYKCSAIWKTCKCNC